MKVFILPFGKINLINPHIAEVIINEGTILDKPEVEAYQNLLRSQLKPPFSVLINMENAYSYTFEAQLAMGDLKDIVYRAVVVYNHNAEMATKIIMNLNKNNNWNIRLFRERQEALDWLHINVNNRSAV
ncbi:hypothetical protein ES692_13625 [Psychroserpens burtonensis]|uniref:STAS/SEC14 domain-containing protein n=1 Tax=Psychroserpens burtonensis TaxID=49278 RepID=A0A5C7B8C8_9FLAO|nr:hypothetical protein [Psychroserpens burtonensis]TXE16167.1 hypothetical protein ES692_13625 [Psychroserpens burtonensis]